MFFPSSHSILLASLVDSAKCWLAAMLFCVHTFATLGLDFTLLSHNNFQLPRVRLPPLWYATVNHPHQGWGGPHERDKIPWKNHGFFERPLRTFSSWFWFLLVRFLKVQPGGGFRGFFWCNRQVFFFFFFWFRLLPLLPLSWLIITQQTFSKTRVCPLLVCFEVAHWIGLRFAGCFFFFVSKIGGQMISGFARLTDFGSLCNHAERFFERFLMFMLHAFGSQKNPLPQQKYVCFFWLKILRYWTGFAR